MITPLFKVDQNEDFVFINIRAPYIKATSLQFEVADDVFVFSLPPYYLRLRLPGMLIEDEFMDSQYDLKTNEVKCRVSKLNKGEEFKDLDMLSKLLATKKQTNVSKPLIQEVDDENYEYDSDIDFEEDIEIEQNLSEPLESGKSIAYGFNNQYTEHIGVSVHAGNEINELDEPETTPPAERLIQMKEKTMKKFDPQYYLADLNDDEMIQELIKFDFITDFELNAVMHDRLVKLGNRKFLLSDPKSIYLGLVPLVFAWAYDHRTNMGDLTVESSWTVGKLSPSLCFLYNDYHKMKDLIIDCSERALSQPLYRHWQLIISTWGDVLKIFENGKKALLFVMVKLLEIFENEVHFCYRQIFIEDYAIWVQYASEKVIESLFSELNKAIHDLSKRDVRFQLRELEVTGLGEHMEDSDDESE